MTRRLAAIFVYRSTFKSVAHYHAACRIFAACPEAGEEGIDPAEAHRLIAEAREDGKIRVRDVRDFKRAIDHALDLPMPTPELCERLERSEATYSDALQCLTDAGELMPQAARKASAIKKFVQLLGFPLTEIATEKRFDRAVSKVSPARLVVTCSTFASMKSRALAGVRLVDKGARTLMAATDLPADWRRLHDAAKAMNMAGDLAKLWPLMRFCVEREIGPEELDDEAVDAFERHIEATGRDWETVRHTIYAWGRLQTKVAEWPAQPLARRARSGTKISGRGLSSLPEAAQAVWFDYERGLQQAPGSLADLVHDDGLDFNDILNGTDNRVLTLYKPATVTAQRSIFCQLAHHVGARGVTSLGDVCQPTVVAECLTTISKRTDKRKSSYLKNIATAAITFALQSKLSEQDVERLRHMRDRVDPNLKSVKTDKRTGRVRRQYDTHRMGDRHRRRLEQFAEPENLRRLFALPELLIDPVRRKVSRKISVRPEDVNDAVVALIHVILLSAPIRRANLATLRIAGPTANVIIPKKGLVRISIDWTETKNAQPLFAELDIAGSDLLRFFVKKVRPVMLTHAGADVSNPFLFAGGAGDGHRAPGNLARLFTGRNRKHGGFHLNLHCMRHLAAKIVLDQDPAQMELVRQMLGHKTIETTRSYYAQAQSALAQHRYHEILASARGGSVEARAQ